MKKLACHSLLITLLTCTFSCLWSQSVGINNPQPDPSAILDVTSTAKGVLIPRLSLPERDAIANPAQGLMVFVTTDTSFHYFTGDQWRALQAPVVAGPDGVVYTAGEGIQINGTQISNLGDTDPTNDIEVGTAATGDLAGDFPNPQVAGIQGRPIGDADPVDGQVLKWDGTQWAPANDNEGDASYEAGEGIELTGTTISNSAPDIPITLSGTGGTVVSGAYPDFIISSPDSSATDLDSDPNNEIQTLTVTGDTLELSGANRITLPTSSLWKENGEDVYYDVGKVGINLPEPLTDLHMSSGADVLIGDSTSGSGFKLLYYGQKGAFRVGFLNNPFGGYNYDNFWDYDSVGFYSFAAGQNSRAKGFGSFAFGSFGWADGSGSVAFFGNARGNNSFTFGGSSRGRGSITFEGVADEEGGIAMYGYTGGRYGVSIGGGTTGLGASSSREDYAIAIGWNSDARGQASIALGPSDAYGYNSFSTGWVTEARGNYSSTFGYQTNSYPYASMALGRFNVITGDSASWRGEDPIFMVGDGSSSTNRSNSFIIQKNGQTAIGYDDPIAMLQVSTGLGTLNNEGNLDLTNAALLLGTETAGMAFDANQVESIGSDLYFNFNSDADVRIGEGGGNVGVGLDPSARLDIAQSADTEGGGLRLRSAGNSNTFWDQYYEGTTQDLTFAFNGNEVASIDAANGAFTQLSDRRVKKDVQPMESTLKKVTQLEPVSYRYQHQTGEESPSIGFIAQDVEALFPQLVKDKGDVMALSYAEFSVIAIKAIQEQQSQLEHLAKQLSLLQQQLDEIKNSTTNSSK